MLCAPNNNHIDGLWSRDDRVRKQTPHGTYHTKFTQHDTHTSVWDVSVSPSSLSPTGSLAAPPIFGSIVTEK